MVTDRRTGIFALLGIAALVAACAAPGDTSAPRSPSVPATASAQPPPTTAAATTSPSPTAPPLPQGSDPFELDPADFVATIDNPFWPMAIGNAWTYREADAEGAEQKVEVTVTDDTKEIEGITATVVHDVVTEDGELVEDTLDWYAQDAAGNIWYLGEDTKEYEGGEVVSTEGSWTAGVDGALAGNPPARGSRGRDGVPAGVLRR